MGERHHRYVWHDGSSKQSGGGGGGQASISQIHMGSYVLTRICSETKKGGINHIVCGMMRTTRYDALCEWNEQEGHQWRRLYRNVEYGRNKCSTKLLIRQIVQESESNGAQSKTKKTPPNGVCCKLFSTSKEKLLGNVTSVYKCQVANRWIDTLVHKWK